MFAYGPSDLDPTIRTYPDLDLISRVKIGSGGSGHLGARSGGAARRSKAPRRSFTGGSNPDVPVADSGRGLALEQARGTRKPPRWVVRVCDGCSGAHREEGRLCGGEVHRSALCGPRKRAKGQND